MSEQSLEETDELKRLVARLEAEHLASQATVEGQDNSLRLLLLSLAVDRGIYAVRKPGCPVWELLTPEQYVVRRGGKLSESSSPKLTVSSRKRSA